MPTTGTYSELIPSSSGTYYLQFASVNTMVETTLYSTALIKEDSYSTWRELAGLSSTNYPSLDSIVTSSAAMNQIVNSPKAVSYMLASTGSIMLSVLENDAAYNSLTPEIKLRMQNNEHYAKFASLYERTL